MAEKAAAKKQWRAPRQSVVVEDAGRASWDPVLVSHATFILGTSLALLTGLLLGLVLGARLGQGHRARGTRANLTAVCPESIIGACSQGTVRAASPSRGMSASLAPGGIAFEA